MILEMPDGQVIEIPDEYSMLMLMNNGRFGGTGIYFTPGAIMNDGLLDLIFHHGPQLRLMVTSQTEMMLYEVCIWRANLKV